MQRVPSCGHCFKPYAFQGSGRPVGQRIPRLLSCGHTFCHGCVTKLAENIQPRVIVCPTCEEKTPLLGGKNQLKNLPTNLYILGILINNVRATFVKDVAKGELSDFDLQKCFVNTTGRSSELLGSRPPQKDGVKVCEECCNTPAVSQCQKCEAIFCENCFNSVHSSSRTLSVHEAIPLTLTHLTGVLPQTCETHEGRTLEFFDQTEMKLICSLCIVTPVYQGHKIIPANEMTEATAAKIKQSLENVKKVHVQLQKSKRTLSLLFPEIKTEFNEVVQNIREHFEDLHTKLQAREVNLIKDVKDTFCNQSFLTEVAKEITAHSEELSILIEQGTAALSVPSIIMKIGEALLSKMADFEDIPCVLPKSFVQNLVKISYPKEFLDALGSYGSLCSESCNVKLKTISEQLCDDENETKESAIVSNTSESKAPVSPVRSSGSLLSTPSRQNLVYVTHVKNPCDFMVQHAADGERIDNLMEAINTYCQGAKSMNDVVKSTQVGDLVCAQYSMDQYWYRARIIGEQQRASVPKGRNQPLPMVEVQFIDYGNMEVVPLNRLRKIVPEFTDIPELATNCSLVDIVPPGQCETWPAQSIKAFGSLVRDKSLLMGVIRKSGGKFFVDLMSPKEDPTQDDDKPASVRDALVFLEVAHFSSPASVANPEVAFPVRTYKKVMVPKEGETAEVTVTHAETPDSVYVMRDSGKEYADTLSIIGQMSTMYSSKKGNQWQIMWPYKGLVCAARFSGDQVWYRALVTDVTSDSTVRVFYVDFGNYEEISFSEIRRIPDHMTQLPMQAMCCRLAGIEPADAEQGWSNECCTFLADTCTLNRYDMKVVDAQGDELMSVVLHQTNAQQATSINEQLVLKSFAALSSSGDTECFENLEEPSSPAVSNVSTIGGDADDSTSSIGSDQGKLLYPKQLCYLPVEMPKTNKFQFVVSYVDKDCAIYGWLPDSTDSSLPQFMTHMQKICKEGENSSVTQDQLSFNQPCCAEYSDERWYRAQVVDFPTPSTVLVDYVDFGNRAEVPLTSINLNAAFLDIPKQCLSVQLEGLPQTPVEQAKVSKFLEDLLVETMCEAVTSTKPTIHGVVKVDHLTLADGRDVVDVAREMMLKLREKEAEIPDKLSQPPSPKTRKDDNKMPRKLEPTRKSMLADTVLPAEGIPFDVTVTQINSTNVVFLQRSPTSEGNPNLGHDPTRVIAYDHIDQLLDMSARINSSNYFNDKLNVGEIRKNMLCCARYTEDDLWYRAQVTEVVSNDPLQVQMLYVDYGTSEVIGLDRIKAFPAELLSLPRQAFQCVVAGLGDGVDDVESTDLSTDSLVSAVVDKHLICVIVNSGSPIVVELYDRVFTGDTYQDIPISQRVLEMDQIVDDVNDDVACEEAPSNEELSTKEQNVKVDNVYDSGDGETKDFAADVKAVEDRYPAESFVNYDRDGVSNRPQLLTPAQFLLKKDMPAEREKTVIDREEAESEVD